MAVSGLDALVGTGLPAPGSMFNRMCRSIFTRRESNLSQGWLRAKVLVGGEGSAGLVWGAPEWGQRDGACGSEEPAEVGGEGWLGLLFGQERR